MLTLLEKEFKGYFQSPIGYVFLTFFLFMFGLYFTMYNVFSQNGDFSYVLGSLTTVMVFALPALTMRLLSEERKNKTDQLLITAPIKVSQLVIGKFLSAATLYTLMLAITLIYPFILKALGPIPIARIVTAYIGFYLLGLTLIAVGLFLSSICENQVIAAIGTIGTYLLFMMIDSIAVMIPKDRTSSMVFVIVLVTLVIGFIYFELRQGVLTGVLGGTLFAGVVGFLALKPELLDGLPTKILQWFSVFTRYDDFSRGLLNMSSVVYYVSFMSVFILLTIKNIEKRSWR